MLKSNVRHIKIIIATRHFCVKFVYNISKITKTIIVILEIVKEIVSFAFGKVSCF